jgi:hypothetical protein
MQSGQLAGGTPKDFLIYPGQDNIGRFWKFGWLLLVYFQPGIVWIEVISPSWTSTFGFLGHVTEPKHRLIFPNLIDRRAP